MGNHAIGAIKNEKNQYLQYFDKRWNSWLFINCKLPNGDDSEAIKEEIQNKLKIDKNLIEARCVGYKRHRKFSESAKKEKEYVHYFYDIHLNTRLNLDDFEIDGILYKWYTYEELMNDSRIQKVNGDVIGFMKEFGL